MPTHCYSRTTGWNIELTFIKAFAVSLILQFIISVYYICQIQMWTWMKRSLLTSSLALSSVYVLCRITEAPCSWYLSSPELMQLIASDNGISNCFASPFILIIDTKETLNCQFDSSVQPNHGHQVFQLTRSSHPWSC